MFPLPFSLLNCEQFQNLRMYVSMWFVPSHFVFIELKVQLGSKILNKFEHLNIEENCWKCSKIIQSPRQEIEPACSPQN